MPGKTENCSYLIVVLHGMPSPNPDGVMDLSQSGRKILCSGTVKTIILFTIIIAIQSDNFHLVAHIKSYSKVKNENKMLCNFTRSRAMSVEI